MKTRIEVYEDNKLEWRWRAVRKGRTVADSGEGYKKRAQAMSEARKILASPVAVYVQDNETGEMVLAD